MGFKCIHFPVWLYIVNQGIKEAFGLATQPFSLAFSSILPSPPE